MRDIVAAFFDKTDCPDVVIAFFFRSRFDTTFAGAHFWTFGVLCFDFSVMREIVEPVLDKTDSRGVVIVFFFWYYCSQCFIRGKFDNVYFRGRFECYFFLRIKFNRDIF